MRALVNPFWFPPDEDVLMQYAHLVLDNNPEYEAHLSWYRQQWVSVSDLIPTQDVARMDPYGSVDATEGDPLVLRLGGRLFLLDGHHRACWAGQCGSMRVWVVDA